jgi:hypothetical protein
MTSIDCTGSSRARMGDFVRALERVLDVVGDDRSLTGGF